MRVKTVIALLAVLLCVTFALAQQPAPAGPATQVKYDAATISGLSARNIGSAMMSGRIDAVSATDEKGRIKNASFSPAREM